MWCELEGFWQVFILGIFLNLSSGVVSTSLLAVIFYPAEVKQEHRQPAGDYLILREDTGHLHYALRLLQSSLYRGTAKISVWK